MQPVSIPQSSFEVHGAVVNQQNWILATFPQLKCFSQPDLVFQNFYPTARLSRVLTSLLFHIQKLPLAGKEEDCARITQQFVQQPTSLWVCSTVQRWANTQRNGLELH